MKRAILLLALPALLAACGAKDDDSVLEAWKAAGLSVAEMKDAGERVKGGRCRQGRIEALEVTLCAFDSPETARQAEDAGFDLLGDGVGLSLAEGKALLVVGDPEKTDKNGKRMNEVAKVFRAKMRG